MLDIKAQLISELLFVSFNSSKKGTENFQDRFLEESRTPKFPEQ